MRVDSIDVRARASSCSRGDVNNPALTSERRAPSQAFHSPLIVLTKNAPDCYGSKLAERRLKNCTDDGQLAIVKERDAAAEIARAHASAGSSYSRAAQILESGGGGGGVQSVQRAHSNRQSPPPSVIVGGRLSTRSRLPPNPPSWRRRRRSPARACERAF